MTARIVKVESPKVTWYEIQVKVLGIFWINASILKTSIREAYLDLEDAVSKLEDLKTYKTKRSIERTVEL
jgi:hypothetical protein